MNWLRRFIVLTVFANIGVLIWWHFEPPIVRQVLPGTESGIPGLILHQEYRQLELGKQRLQGVCWRVGPYADEVSVGRAWQSLEYIAVEVQKHTIKPLGETSYKLTVPASPSSEAAVILAESLSSMGIPSPKILPDNSLSLGRYPDLKQAEVVQRQAQQLGIEVLLASERDSPPAQWWLDVTVRNAMGFAQWQAEQLPRVTAISCQETVSPEPSSVVQ